MAAEVHRAPIPSGYRVIASGDVVPVFDPTDPPRWLVLFDDGSVGWTSEPPPPSEDRG